MSLLLGTPRRRISRIFSADAHTMVVNAFSHVQKDRRIRGNTCENVAEMLRMAAGTVKNVMREWRELQSECKVGEEPHFDEREDVPLAGPVPERSRPDGKSKPTGKGGRATVIEIGSELSGTIGELLEAFRGKNSTSTDDHHKEKNAEFIA